MTGITKLGELVPIPWIGKLKGAQPGHIATIELALVVLAANTPFDNPVIQTRCQFLGANEVEIPGHAAHPSNVGALGAGMKLMKLYRMEFNITAPDRPPRLLISVAPWYVPPYTITVEVDVGSMR